MNKKNTLLLGMLALILAISGCGLKKNTTMMDELNNKGNYTYTNKDLGFSLDLPAEFIYYQTQRVNGDGYVDLEFLVPVSDPSFNAEIPGYGNAVTVRVYDKEKWKEIETQESIYEKIGSNWSKVYTINYWKEIPADWQNKWNEEVKNKIKEGFKKQ